MIKVYPITITQDEFKTAPLGERLFYLKLGALANEISVLNKVTLASLSPDLTSTLNDDVKQLLNRSSSTMAMLFIRLLGGRLYEAHGVITSGYNPLKLAYRSTMKGKGRNHYNLLNAYFSRHDNFVKLIRHKLAFHTDPESFSEAIESMDEDEHIVDYMSSAVGNTLFWGSEAAVICALKSIAKANTAEVAYKMLMDDTTEAAKHTLGFIYSFAIAFFRRNFPDKLPKDEAGRIAIEDAPVLTEFRLPWFFETPTDQKTAGI